MKRTCAVVLLSALLVSSSEPVARGASISSDISLGFRQKGNGGGTSSYFAHSERTTHNGNPAPAGPNQSSSYFSSPISQGGQTILSPVPVDPNVEISTPRGVFGMGTPVNYSPVVSVGNKPKPVPPLEAEDVYSTSGTPGIEAIGSAGINIQNGTIVAKGATSHASVGGTAAGAAFDPESLNGGLFTNYNEYINVEIALDNSGDSGGLLFFAVDERFVTGGASGVDNFYDSFPIDEALWSLSIWATGNTAADINVDFRINPSARASNILNPLDPDASITLAIKNSFSYQPGSATLTNIPVFPSGTTWDLGSGTYFGLGNNAGIDAVGAVPEPSTLVLLASGVGCLLATRRARKGNRACAST